MDLSESDSTPSKPRFPIVCRVNPNWWWMVVLGIFEGAFMMSGPFLPHTDNPNQPMWPLALLTWPMGLAMLWGVLAMAFDLARGEIRADETGLTWRRLLGRWESARWDEVTGFYQKRLGDRGSRIVVTPSGQLQLSSLFEGVEKIGDLVPQRATGLGKTSWEVMGSQWGQKWPVVVKAWSAEEQWIAPMVTSLLPLSLALYVGMMLADPSQRPYFTGSFDVVPVLILACLLFLPVIGLEAWVMRDLWRERNFARRFQGVQIVFDPEGFTFTGLDQTIQATWTEVLCVTSLGKVDGQVPVEIRTTHGDFVIWWNGRNAGMWQRARRFFRHFVPALLAPEEEAVRRRNTESIDLQGESGAWTGGAVGQGSPRWSFRSSSNRFLCQCASWLAPLLPFIYLLNIYAGPGKNSDVQPEVSWPHFAALCLAAALILVVGWVWYGNASIVASEEALEIQLPFGLKRRAAWRDIESSGRDAFGDFVMAKGHKLHFTWFVLPVRVEELREYIKARIHENSN